MHWIDVAVLFVLAFCTFLGVVRGIVIEGLGALALGIAVAVALVIVDAMYPADGAVSSTVLTNDNYVKVIVYLIVVGLAVYVPKRLAISFRNSVSIIGIGRASRLFGGGVGFLRGAGYAVAAYLLAELVIPPSEWPSQWRQARSLSIIYGTVKYGSYLLPKNMRPNIKPPPGYIDYAGLQASMAAALLSLTSPMRGRGESEQDEGTQAAPSYVTGGRPFKAAPGARRGEPRS